MTTSIINRTHIADLTPDQTFLLGRICAKAAQLDLPTPIDQHGYLVDPDEWSTL